MENKKKQQNPAVACNENHNAMNKNGDREWQSSTFSEEKEENFIKTRFFFGSHGDSDHQSPSFFEEKKEEKQVIAPNVINDNGGREQQSLSFFDDKYKGKQPIAGNEKDNKVVNNNPDILVLGGVKPSCYRRTRCGTSDRCIANPPPEPMPTETNPLYILAEAAVYLSRVRTRKGTGKAVHVKAGKKRKQETETSSSNQEAEGGRKKKVYGKKANLRRLGLVPPPDLPQTFREIIEGMGGQDLRLVITKQIWGTDINPHHDRFSIPQSQLQNKFLTEEEETILSGVDGDCRKQKVEVAVILDPLRDGRVSRLHVGRWNRSYVLTHGWNDMVARHGDTLNVGAIVQLWSFRMDEEELWFVLVKVHDGEGDGGADCGDKWPQQR